jgi:hypothetical protein
MAVIFVDQNTEVVMCTPGAFLGGRRELAQDLDHTGLQLMRYRALSHAS